MNGTIKSLDPYKQISAALLRDVQTLHSEVFSMSALDATTGRLSTRLAEEGLGFLTETLPRLGKRLDKALASGDTFNVRGLRFKTLPNSELPEFLGELFRLVFNDDGSILPTPSVSSVRSIRQVCYSFYKLELGYAPALEQAVIEKFVRTDRQLSDWNEVFFNYEKYFAIHNPIATVFRTLEKSKAVWDRRADSCLSGALVLGASNDVIEACLINASVCHQQSTRIAGQLRWLRILRAARVLLARLFRHFDPKDIIPSHGPGAVSTREQLWDKWTWTHIPDRIAQVWPIDEYFFVNLDHVCDRLQYLMSRGDMESPARVVLVPKDSRGPRLISCEPLENQWIQQGLGRAIVQLVESHPLTRYEVRFTDQTPNQVAALHGSSSGVYSTLDLEEASDRVCLGLVHLLFPEPLRSALMAARSQETQLPDGQKIKLQKFAPMGSALCFPIMALTIWSLLKAGAVDAGGNNVLSLKGDTVDGHLLVYGDDVIVKTAKAADAINILESFGLKVGRDKSCTGVKGLFRESCGMDAFRGVSVTPVRFRTAWTSAPRPEPYMSYIEYANALCKRGYHYTHRQLCELLFRTYGPLADDDWELPVPSVIDLPDEYRSNKRRTNYDLQKVERRVLDVCSRPVTKAVDGWMMLLRYFTSKVESKSFKDIESRMRCLVARGLIDQANDTPRRSGVPDWVRIINPDPPISVLSYTKRSSNSLAWRWR